MSLSAVLAVVYVVATIGLLMTLFVVLYGVVTKEDR